MYKGEYSIETRLKMISILGDENDFDYIQDCIINFFPDFYNLDEAKKNIIYTELLCLVPDSTLGSAYSYGLSDTVVRDNIYEYIEDNREQLKKVFEL